MLLRFHPAVLALALLLPGSALAQSFEDSFASNTTATYALTQLEPTIGTGTFVYDAVGQRAQIVAGNDFGLLVTHTLPSRTAGRFGIDLLPTQKWPNGGKLTIRLRQDASNYYEVFNSDGYGPGYLRKVVGGAVVATTNFTSGYSQNAATHLNFDFGPGASTLSAFGQSLAINQAASLAITSLEIEAFQQSSFVDGISLGDIVNLVPAANAGPDQSVTAGAVVALDGSDSIDLDGTIQSYAWQQISGPAVAISNANTAHASFTAPNPGSGSVSLVFRLTVTDNAGAPANDTVQVDSWNAASLRFQDDFAVDSTGGYTLTLIEPTIGTGTFVYDAAAQRGQIRTGNDFGLRVAHGVPPRTGGRFSVDLLPTQKWPSSGRIFLRLLQDTSNYYEISNYDGQSPGLLRKVVNGTVVASANFSAGYVQNTAYHVNFDFAPGTSNVIAFGQSIGISNATPLTIRSLEIETFQQTMYVDNLSYGDVQNTPPVANAGPDQGVAAGELVQLTGSGSSDPDGQINAYQWQQVSGPGATLSSQTVANPTFFAPNPGSGHVPMVFSLTVTDNGGAQNSDTVSIETWAPSALSFSDAFTSDTTGAFTQTLLFPENGTSTFVFDAVNQRAQIRTGNDFGMNLGRSVPPRTSGRFSVNLLPTKKYPSAGRITIRLMQDAQNYYKIENFDGSAPGALTKVVNGAVVATAPFQNGYVQNTAYTPLVFDWSPTLSTLDAFGQFLALEQNTAVIRVQRLEIEAFQQDVFVDDLIYTDFVEQQPFAKLTAPGDFSFQTSSTLAASAISFRFQPGWRMAFALDKGTPAEVLTIDATAPYTASFSNVPKGTHTVDAYAVDAGGAQVPGALLHDQVAGVEIGDEYVGIGDSITLGQGDDFPGDDTSNDGRNSGGGYEPILNNLLTADTGFANSIDNEGVGGRTTTNAIPKMNSMLNAHPNANFVLLLFGTNDSKTTPPLPSGLHLQPGNNGYAGSYKANMQTLINAVLARNMLPVVAKVPIAYGSSSHAKAYPDPPNAPQNVLIREYNQVIDELVAENGLPISGPDLYTYFAAHPEQMSDRLHPNGVGYQGMADLWRDALLAP